MAAAVFRATLRGWRTGVPSGCRLRRLSQTQGPPDYPSFVESVDEYQFVERLLPLPASQSPRSMNIIPLLVVGSHPETPTQPALLCAALSNAQHPCLQGHHTWQPPDDCDPKGGGRHLGPAEGCGRFSESTAGKTPVTQINEVTGTLRVKGYFDQQLKAWLLEKGF